jgi:thioredoxin 1
LVKQAAADLVGEGAVALINVDQNRGVGRQYGVRGIPALVVLKDGEMVGTIQPRSRDQIVAEFRNFF